MESLKRLYNTCEEQYDAAITAFDEENCPVASDLENEESRLLLWNLNTGASSGSLDSFNEQFQFLHTEIYDCLNEISSNLVQLARITTVDRENPSSQGGNQHQSKVKEFTSDIDSDLAKLRIKGADTQHLPGNNSGEIPAIVTSSLEDIRQDSGDSTLFDPEEPVVRSNPEDLIEQLKILNDVLFSLQRAASLATREPPSKLLASENYQNESFMIEAGPIGEKNDKLESSLTHTTGTLAARTLNQTQSDSDDMGNILHFSQTNEQIDQQGEDHLKTISSAKSRADSYAKQGQYTAALICYKRALAEKEKSVGVGHPSTLGILSDLACTYNSQGSYKEALRYYARVLLGYEKTLGREHQSTLDTANDLGVVYSCLGQYENALEWFKRALAGYVKVYGGDHPSTLNTANNMGQIFANQGRYEKASRYFERVLVVYEKTLGSHHPSTLETFRSMGLVCYNLDQYKDALEWFKRALDGYMNSVAYRGENPSTLNIINDIGMVYKCLNQNDHALNWLLRALAGTEKVLGKEHPSTLDTANNIGHVYTNLGHYENALKYFERVLVVYEKTPGEDHLWTIEIVHNMGFACYAQGMYAEALEWFERALARKEKVLGNEHSSTLVTLDCISAARRDLERFGPVKQGRGDIDPKQFELQLRRQQVHFGHEHRLTLNTTVKIGDVYSKLGKNQKALWFYTQALFGQRNRRDHLLALQTIEKINSITQPAESATAPQDPWMAVQNFLL